MSVHDYLIDHDGFHWPAMLAGWADLLPSELTVWLMNRYGDLFLVYPDGSVHRLDVGRGSVGRLADNRDDFLTRIDEDDNAAQWLMMPLVDAAVEAGMILGSNDCYGYKKPPVLGGDYTVENTHVLPIPEHFGFNADLYRQLKDVPDGTSIRVEMTD